MPSQEFTPLTRLALAALGILLPCACGQRDSAPDAAGAAPGKANVTRVAILADDVADPMRNYQLTLLTKLIRTRSHMEVSAVSAGGNADVQARQVREAVQARAAFLMVFPLDAARLAPELRAAVQAGARVFVFSQDLPDDACTSAVYTDERQLGRMAGDYVVSALTAKAQAEALPLPVGRVVMLRGAEDSARCQIRSEGFLSALDAHPGIVLVHDAPCEWSEKSAADRTREALRIQKQFDVIYAQNDLIASGAAKVVRESSAEARDSMLILGTDGVPGKGSGVSMVARGEIDATVYQPPLVDVAWEEMQKLLDSAGASVRKRVQIRPFMITPENAGRIQRTGLPAPEIEAEVGAAAQK